MLAHKLSGLGLIFRDLIPEVAGIVILSSIIRFFFAVVL